MKLDILKSIRQYLKLINLIRRFKPDRMLALIRHFEYTLGGKESYNKKVPVNKDNEAWPWYTYPAIEYICQFDFSQCVVFEYGSGNSSTFWAHKAQKVISVESNPVWFDAIQSTKTENQKVMLFSTPDDYVNSIHLDNEMFDVIVIDADYRFNCANEVIKRLKQGGLIILDNSDWYPNTAKILTNNGFKQTDFIGWGPVNSYAWATSIFANGDIRIPRVPQKNIEVLGGIYNLADDDKKV